MQPHRSKIIGFLSLFLLLGCAAQTSFREYERSKALLEAAERVEPLHPRIEHGRLALEAGYDDLRAGQYSQASRRFRQVERAAEEVLEWSEKEKAALEEAEERREEALPVVPQAQIPVDAPKPSPTPQVSSRDRSRSELPAEALATYLARKRANESAPPMSPEKEPEPKEAAPQVSARAPEGARVIEAQTEESRRAPVARPAEPSPPSLEDLEANPAPSLAQAAPAPSNSRSEDANKPRQSVPGFLEFSDSQLDLSVQVMDRLDQMSVYLLDNPSNSLILTGSKGPNEADSTVRARFEAIQSYLLGKGVPEDQVRLDAEINSASTGRVVMSLIEH